MEKKAIEHFWEYSLTPSALTNMPLDQQAAFSILCFAVSETNAIARLYIFNAHNLVGIDAIDVAASIQRNLLLRTWSAKLFEVEQFLRTISGTKPKTKDATLIAFADEALENFSTLDDADAYPFVRAIRNEMANHYSFDAAKKNLRHVPKHANFNFYMHEMNGNSFYPMGEEVMFVGRMNRHGANFEDGPKPSQLEEWMNWNLSANRWLSETHANFVRNCVLSDENEMRVRKESYWIPPELVGTKNERLAPLFVRVEK